MTNEDLNGKRPIVVLNNGVACAEFKRVNTLDSLDPPHLHLP
jgi:hypothetical protein